MPTYTVQRYDGRLKPLKTRVLVCADDNAALDAAALIRHAGPFLLSQAGRRIWWFNSDVPTHPAPAAALPPGSEAGRSG